MTADPAARDIVDRLLDHQHGCDIACDAYRQPHHPTIYSEAADEIVRLREQVAASRVTARSQPARRDPTPPAGKHAQTARPTAAPGRSG